jgi:hypothetical protein
MLIRLVVMLSVVAAGLALAACAETAELMAAHAAEEAAVIAATQATIATTQAIKQLEASSTQMSGNGQVVSGHGMNLPLPPVNKGTFILFTPQYMIIQKDGKRLIVPRENYQQEEDGDSNP